MAEEDTMPDDIESDEVLNEQVDNSEISSEEEGFLSGYNEESEPDRSDEEGLEDDERLEG
ncbi:MAG: hypothetical protein ACQER9_00160 [Nanobdellota archaeon]